MSNEKEQYEQLMRRCIELAGIAKQRGDSPVGCIIVREGIIIAEGIEGGKTHKDITFHAEIEAVRNARSFLSTADSPLLVLRYRGKQSPPTSIFAI